MRQPTSITVNKDSIYIVTVNDGTNPIRTFAFPSCALSEPNSDDIVAYASDVGIIEIDDVPNATGKQTAFAVGDTVDAEPKEGDFAHEFTGTIIGTRNSHIVVRDQENNAFECDEDQLTAEENQPDFHVRNEGSIFLLCPLTQAAKDWIAEHIPDDAQRLGNNVAVEHRYIADIVQGIQGDGLTAI